jgi:hypothetical protein
MRRHNIIKQNYKHNKLRQHFEQYGKLLTPGAIDLLEKMLCLDPKKRVDAITAFGVRCPRHGCRSSGKLMPWLASHHCCESASFTVSICV